jgi:hypothetical protein
MERAPWTVMGVGDGVPLLSHPDSFLSMSRRHKSIHMCYRPGSYVPCRCIFKSMGPDKLNECSSVHSGMTKVL